MTSNLSELNREWWVTWHDAVNAEYSRDTIGDNLRKKVNLFSTLENCSGSLASDAFALCCIGKIDAGRIVAAEAAKVSRVALERESYERIFSRSILTDPEDPGSGIDDPTFVLTATQVAIQIAKGRTTVMRNLHYAVWLQSGEWDVEILNRALPHLEIYFDKYLRRHYRDAADVLMLEYAKAGRFADILKLGNTLGYKDDLLLPGRGRKKQAHALFLLATSLEDGDSLQMAAREATEYWYQRARKWYMGEGDFAWWERLGWAWLNGKYFSGVTERDALLLALRGY